MFSYGFLQLGGGASIGGARRCGDCGRTLSAICRMCLLMPEKSPVSKLAYFLLRRLFGGAAACDVAFDMLLTTASTCSAKVTIESGCGFVGTERGCGAEAPLVDGELELRPLVNDEKLALCSNLPGGAFAFSEGSMACGAG